MCGFGRTSEEVGANRALYFWSIGEVRLKNWSLPRSLLWCARRSRRARSRRARAADSEARLAASATERPRRAWTHPAVTRVRVILGQLS
jgi:hypothetical protein